ncbi:uncharacterized protein FIBRA_05032 [Fibroporia radiculosa]|uniref:UFSP1/2/DUB catalytic domain-containing protein n=1 Tax=Fibroporia radiculosa TaxID=599839 RepID=J4G8D8_9APHY|nr:uncharacterized protein FIBRA_05032 [Fibroporia radiculosa]CCM02918.1 predicted protein [Fibroporia radiculosa]
MHPGVRNLQSLIEEAWSKGFDEEGAEQLKRNLVGTGKYIGTAELYVAFTYRGIPARLADFDLNDGVEVLLNWVLQHFCMTDTPPVMLDEDLSSKASVIVTEKMPLIFQHDGHSRTIVGCERCADGSINLLIFDPSRYIPPNVRDAGLRYHATDLSGGTTSSQPVSLSNVLHEALHPVQTIKAHKRKADNTSTHESSKKHRGGSGSIDGLTNDVTRNGGLGPTTGRNEVQPDASKVLGIFRLNANKLKRKRQYQILYFPLTDPLTEIERRARRLVTSLKIH